MSIQRLYQLIKTKSITITSFNNFLITNNLNMDLLRNYKNSFGENILIYGIKYGINIKLFNYLCENGIQMDNNLYNMTPIDLCVVYNKNPTHQKLLILDWLYSNNILFNPEYLLLYPRIIIKWLRNKKWNLEIKKGYLGNTALHEICKVHHPRHLKNLYKKFTFTNNSYDAFYFLLEIGYDPHMENNYGITAIDYCIKNSLINNLNILYHFNYCLTTKQLNLLISTDNYYKLLDYSMWLINNYYRLNLDLSKKELENKLLNKIINIQKSITSYSTKYDSLLSELTDTIFCDKEYNINLFNVDNNMYFN